MKMEQTADMIVGKRFHSTWMSVNSVAMDFLCTFSHLKTELFACIQ